MTACKFHISNNALTTISGADAGTYAIKDNAADIVISGSTTKVYPFDSDNIVDCTNNEITINI
jgi:hypothetical protein